MITDVIRQWLPACLRPGLSSRWRASAAAREDSEYPHFFEDADDILFTLDLQGRFTSINKAVERITGFSKKEILCHDMGSLVAPEHAALNDEMWRKRLAGENVPPYCVDFACKNWERLSFEINHWLIRKDGLPTGVHGIARNFTPRKQAEEALRNSEKRFKDLADLLPQTVYECDLQGRFTFINKASYKMFGYSPEDFNPELNVFQMLHPDELERARGNLRLLFEGKGREGDEYIAKRKDGSYFPTLIFPSLIYRDNKPIGFRGLLIDLTEQRNLEAQLRQSQKMECIGQLAAGVAHDFNNILTIVHGHASMMASRQGLSPSMAESLGQIVSASRRATDLIRQLLSFGRKQIMKPTGMDLNKLATGLATLLPRLLGEHISLKIECAQRLPVIRADATMIEQVLMNLSVNARDAMPSGGQLSISTALCNFEIDEMPGHPEARAGRFVRLTVADNGCGMSKATLERIFEPFFTTKESGKGSGLGLATVYGIVKQHSGWIMVSSKINVGTTFDVYLPACAISTQSEPAREGDAEFQMIRGAGETILVVEDEPAVRQMVIGLLQSCGYRVLEAMDGPAALEIWERERGRFDLLFTDMVMPGGISGRDLAIRLRSIDPDLKVVFTSGFSEELLNLSPGWMGTDLFIAKPFQPLSLSQIIQKALGNKPKAVVTAVNT
jgi:PAS domain S-box-containing protein